MTLVVVVSVFFKLWGVRDSARYAFVHVLTPSVGRGGDRCLGGEWGGGGGVVTTHTEIMVPLGLACNTVKGFLSKASASRADLAGVRGGQGCVGRAWGG